MNPGAKEINATFISYAREDSHFVMRLAGDLRAAGAALWLDQLDIAAGERWDVAIEASLRECPQFMAVLSPVAVRSQNVLDEVSYALDEGKRVIPVLYQDCLLPFRLRRLQYVDFRTDYATGLRQLIGALGVITPVAPSQSLTNGPYENDQATETVRGTAGVKAVADDTIQNVIIQRPLEPNVPRAWPWPKSELAVLQQKARKKKWGADDVIHRATPLLVLSEHTDAVRSVAWSPSGQWLASGGDDGKASVCDSGTGKRLSSLKCYFSIFDVAWSPNEKRLATATADKTEVWEVATNQVVLSLTGRMSIAWSPDGARFATRSKDGTARIWDAESGNHLLSVSGHGGAIGAIGWSPDGKRFAAGNVDGTAQVWVFEPGGELSLQTTLEAQEGAVICLAWSPDGKRLATVGFGERIVKIWDVDTCQGHLWVEAAAEAVAWNPSGSLVATAGRDHGVKVWDAGTGDKRLLLRHRENIESVSWSPDGLRLATGGQDHKVNVWDAGIR